MYDQKPPTIDPIKLAAIMAKENASMHECSLAAQCIRDLHDETVKLRKYRAAVLALLNAKHHDHFAARMSDSELEAIETMKSLAAWEQYISTPARDGGISAEADA